MNWPRWIRRLVRQPFDGLKHFGVVEPGKLYRCGQPRPAQLRQLIEQHGLKTVIALRGTRGDQDRDRWEPAERRVCEEQGVELVLIPFNHKNPPSLAQLEQFLGTLRDPQRLPALVHCRLGQQRTLMFCALYRVHIEGVDPAAAEAEMDALGFNIRHRRHQLLLRKYRELARAQGPAKASA